MRERDAVLIERAADLRQRMTDAEVRLWSRLKGRQLANAKFSRQIAVAGYICDFVCREHRLVVELDGSQHFANEYDRTRDARLKASGYRVLRFWNAEVLESHASLEHVLHRISTALRGSAVAAVENGTAGRERADEPSPAMTAHPLPLPVGEGRFDR